MDYQKKLISIHSVKGGTGKTTIALMLALHFSDKQKKVAVIDFDLHNPNFEVFSNKEIPYYIENFINPNASAPSIPAPKNIFYNIEDRNNNISAAFFSRGPTTTESVYRWLGNSEDSNVIIERQSSLLDYSLKNYDYVIVDNIPGIVWTSLISLHLTRKKQGTVLMVSGQENTDLPNVMMAFLSHKEFFFQCNSILVINRILHPESYNFEEKYKKRYNDKMHMWKEVFKNPQTALKYFLDHPFMKSITEGESFKIRSKSSYDDLLEHIDHFREPIPIRFDPGFVFSHSLKDTGPEQLVFENLRDTVTFKQVVHELVEMIFNK